MNATLCVISTVHRPDDVRIYYKEILSLANAGYKIVFIVQELPGAKVHRNVQMHFLPPGSGLKHRVKNLLRAFRSAKNIDCKVLHIHDPELILIAFPLKLLYRKKIIYDLHEIHSNEIKYKPYLPKVVSYPLSFLFWLFEKIAIHSFDKIILAEAGYAAYFPLKNSVIIQNFIPSEYVLPKPVKYFEAGQAIKLVYLGTITKIRGIFEILELTMLLKNEGVKIELQIIGPFYPKSLRREVERYIEKNHLQDSVRIRGVLTFPEAQQIIKQCDIGLIFLHPILNNLTILPVKLFEYMANGLVVLMTKFPLWEEFNQKYQCGMTLDIFNLNSEIKRVISFFDDINLLNLMRKTNIETVRQNFVWEIEEKKLLTLYAELFGKPGENNE